jgi:hypothetical protein
MSQNQEPFPEWLQEALEGILAFLKVVALVLASLDALFWISTGLSPFEVL